MDMLTQEIIDKVKSADIDHLRNQPVNSVDYIAEKIQYKEFFLNYLIPNRPCVFGPHVTEEWRSVQEWVTETGQPNLDFLTTKFGDATVPAADCNKVQYYAQPKTDMKLSEFMQYWKIYISNGHTSEEGCLYLKDWHFVHVFPDYCAYETPVFFNSDWLNEFWDTRSDSTDDDYRFVYMGPKGSWTPFHADVFRSFSWSANICGRKKWLLFPPGQEEHHRDLLGNLAYDVTSSELHDGKKYPHYNKACQPLEVVQEAGEVIFVPSGWHHQVYNLEDTISINHNWLNGCNVDIMWDFLQQEMSAVQRSISDCRDMDGWHSQCQLIMKASTGIDFSEFFQFLHIIAKRRLNILKRSSSNKDTKVDVSPSQHADNSKEDKTHHQYTGNNNINPKQMEQSNSTNSNVATIQNEQCRHVNSSSETMAAQEEQQSAGTHSLSKLACGTGLLQDTTSEITSIQRTSGTCSEISDVGGADVGGADVGGADVEGGDVDRADVGGADVGGTDVGEVRDVNVGNVSGSDAGVWHSVFDLGKIHQVLECLIGNKEFQEIDSTTLCDDPKRLNSDICQVLERYYQK